MIITKLKQSLGAAKDNENARAELAHQKSLIEYIALCDYPEIFEEDEEEIENE